MSRNESCNLTLTSEVKEFQKAAYIPLIVLGLFFNVTALCAFCCRRSTWTVTQVYMTNLIVADSAIILSLPFKVYDSFNNLNLDLCAFVVSVYFGNMYASIFTATAISLQRFTLIQFPFWGRVLKSPRKAIVVCVLIWVIVLTLNVIYYKENLQENKPKCFERTTKPFPVDFILTVEILGFLLPLCTITFCSTQIICTLSRNKNECTQEEKKRSVRIITANLVVFFICFTPIHVGFLLKFIVAKYYPKDCDLLNTMHNFFHISEWIASTNCCLDALGYYFLAKKNHNNPRLAITLQYVAFSTRNSHKLQLC
uniref:G-protein coupled receptors family 1 profile domain-containing protein n=1 Tax=Lepisosteus oculatus TaxID=7918 RepID=W5MAQ4_LEPOC